MGILAKLFGFRISCPYCNAAGARDGFTGVKCRNPRCSCYDDVYAGARPVEPPPAPGGWSALPAASSPGSFAGPPVAIADPIEIRYVNFRGEHRTFTGSRKSLRRRGAHVSLEVAPTGIRIALKLARISNLGDVEGEIEARRAAGPGPVESRVLRYHAGRGTTSALYETLRRKYPDFDADR